MCPPLQPYLCPPLQPYLGRGRERAVVSWLEEEVSGGSQSRIACRNSLHYNCLRFARRHTQPHLLLTTCLWQTECIPNIGPVRHYRRRVRRAGLWIMASGGNCNVIGYSGLSALVILWFSHPTGLSLGERFPDTSLPPLSPRRRFEGCFTKKIKNIKGEFIL